MTDEKDNNTYTEFASQKSNKYFGPHGHLQKEFRLSKGGIHGATILVVPSLIFGMYVAPNAALQDGKCNQNCGHRVFHCIPEIFPEDFSFYFLKYIPGYIV
jgi:hypothetical protein